MIDEFLEILEVPSMTEDDTEEIKEKFLEYMRNIEREYNIDREKLMEIIQREEQPRQRWATNREEREDGER